LVERFLIGLDFGTDSARGVLISSVSGVQVASAVRSYPHGTLSQTLPSGVPMPAGFSLQVAGDYLDVAAHLLRELGSERQIEAIGIDFTASSPMPCTSAGLPLSDLAPDAPHSYVKLWKHSAQAHAQGLLAGNSLVETRFGGRLSGEWLLAKARQLATEAPDLWARTDRFIEAGDWLVWMLTGVELRSGDFAAYKAQYDPELGYPAQIDASLASKLGPVAPVGTAAGRLSPAWCERTGIVGSPAVSVAIIDSHAVLPAVHDGSAGTLTCAIGTSAAYLYLAQSRQPLPAGVEGVAFDAALPGLWCYEAGQAAYGDVLSWFVATFPRAATQDDNFAAYNEAAQALAPAQEPLVALEWWSGNRVPFSDSLLSGMLLGLTMHTSAAGIYRALVESLCFGTRAVVDLFEAGSLPVERLVVTSGLAGRNPFLVQTLADVLGRPLDVPLLDNATCVGAAIHGAVAAGVVPDFGAGFARFGAKSVVTYTPRHQTTAIYDQLYAQYRALAADDRIREAMRTLRGLSAAVRTRQAEAPPTADRDAPLQRRSAW